jgi:hypothetical protein
MYTQKYLIVSLLVVFFSIKCSLANFWRSCAVFIVRSHQLSVFPTGAHWREIRGSGRLAAELPMHLTVR